MEIFKTTKRGVWPIFTLALLLVSLWGTLFMNGIPDAEQPQPGEHSQTAYEEILPNFLAPVIRKDVQKQPSSEDKPVVININIPRPEFLFTIW